MRRSASPRGAGSALLELQAAGIDVPGRTLLDAADLRVDASDGVVAIVGANGAGKSEFLRACVGLRRLDRGTVRLAGRDPATAKPAALAPLVGFVPQRAGHMLTASTVRDEVAAVSRATGAPADVDATLADLGLADLAERHPWSLSGGERERLAVAAALAHAPALLVLDEPTTGLDGRGRAGLLRVLARRTGAVLLATHEADLAERADRVVRLEGGRLVEGRA